MLIYGGGSSTSTGKVVVNSPDGETDGPKIVELPGGEPIETGIIITDVPSNTGKDKDKGELRQNIPGQKYI